MGFILPILGMVGAFFMLKYREPIGNMMGDAEWMNKVGGVYNVVIFLALFVFFWSIAVLTGTTDILLRPLLWFLPGVQQPASSDF
jgi:hypothetical protein